ncbi:MAG TPA: response regulator [Candidatus Sulfotelmatobacter sp.]|nr:response regulator [Candidatus Sulfotelmatobacter sp.]
MFSLTEAEARALWPAIERLWPDPATRRACGTRADEPVSCGPPARRHDARPTVLVVDDDDDIRDYTAAILEEAGYQVATAASPQEALDRLRDGPSIDLMVTDVVLPEIDGLKLAELAKRRQPALNVLYTSGYPETFERQPVERYGGFLAKPYRSAQLEEAVDAAMARRP